ncbi:MAG: hypothetical protein M1820_004109 [Bogoriella megaspora]|nr:MAG: hypothetical protein M1820_004109 [Bogoriella megaspora]
MTDSTSPRSITPNSESSGASLQDQVAMPNNVDSSSKTEEPCGYYYAYSNDPEVKAHPERVVKFETSEKTQPWMKIKPAKIQPEDWKAPYERGELLILAGNPAGMGS